MPRQIIQITDAIVTLGVTGTETDASCQVNTATITPTGNTVDVPATFCEGASQTASPSSYALDFVILQDWGAVGSVSQYLFDHDAEQQPFHLEGIAVTGATVEVDGTVTVMAGALGGEAGVPITAEVSLPIMGKPTIVATPPVAADQSNAEQDEAGAALYQPA